MSVTIESLARWQRLPGEYFATQVGEGGELVDAADLLREAGHECRAFVSRPGIYVEDPEALGGTSRWMRWILPGDWLVFRRGLDGESRPWVARVCAASDFRRHFRRGKQQ